MKNLPKVGQRVVVKDYGHKLRLLDYNDNIVGQTGVVLEIHEDCLLTTLIKFDLTLSDTGLPFYNEKDCWWVNHKVLKKLT